MKEMIGYCGLDCEKCDAYLATISDDQGLRERTAELWSKLNNVPILPEHIDCEGCRGNGKKTFYCESLCEIRRCAIGRKISTCGDCPEMKYCKKIGELISNNPSVLDNLQA